MIAIKTRIDGRVTTHGAPETITHNEYKTGPRNLIKAVGQVSEIRDRQVLAYGNIGHIKTWVEVDGVALDYTDLADYEYSTDPENYRDDIYRSHTTKTSWAKNLIAMVNDGSLVAGRESYERMSYEEKSGGMHNEH